jgi:hypothetical protein
MMYGRISRLKVEMGNNIHSHTKAEAGESINEAINLSEIAAGCIPSVEGRSLPYL